MNQLYKYYLWLASKIHTDHVCAVFAQQLFILSPYVYELVIMSQDRANI